MEPQQFMRFCMVYMLNYRMHSGLYISPYFQCSFNTRFSNYPYFQMVECPEPVHDNKTLYERLQEQKQKKQDEWDEQHQLSKYLVFHFQC